jgi:hypothetical protein
MLQSAADFHALTCLTYCIQLAAAHREMKSSVLVGGVGGVGGVDVPSAMVAMVGMVVCSEHHGGRVKCTQLDSDRMEAGDTFRRTLTPYNVSPRRHRDL